MSRKMSSIIRHSRNIVPFLRVLLTLVFYSTFYVRPVAAEEVLHGGLHLGFRRHIHEQLYRRANTRVVELGEPRKGPTIVQADDGIEPKIIWVGKQGDLFKQVFTPQTLYQQVGGNVTFQFFPNNHSVVSSTFDNPCEPKATNLPNSFFSSFFPVAVGSEEVPTFTITIQSEDPIFFYCAQGQHCQNGMVGIINPRPDQPFSKFVARAATQPFALAPGSTPPPLSTPIPSNSAANPAAAAFSPPLRTTTAAAKGSVPDGVIIGIVLGGIALLALIGVGAGFIVARKRRQRKLTTRDEGAMINEEGNLRVYAEEGRTKRVGKWMIGRKRRQTEEPMFVEDDRGGSSGSGGSSRRGGISASGGNGSSQGRETGFGRSGSRQYQQPQMGEMPLERPPPIRVHRRNPEGSDGSIVLEGGYRI